MAVALSIIASESLVTQLTSNTVLRTLSRFSYDVLARILDLALLIVVLVEVVRPLWRTLVTGTKQCSREPVLDYTDRVRVSRSTRGVPLASSHPWTRRRVAKVTRSFLAAPPAESLVERLQRPGRLRPSVFGRPYGAFG